MITLAVKSNGSISGPIKKMLHAPTMKLYMVKEVPQSNREVRNILKDWISTWQNEMSGSKTLISIHGTFWN